MAHNILKMHDSGMRLRDICKKYYLHHSQVQQFLAANGRQPHPKAYLTGSKRTHVISLYRTEKMSARQIALGLGISDSTVRKLLHDVGVRIRPRGKLNKQEQKEVCRLYRSGLPSTAIARQFECCDTVVLDTLRNNRVTIRPKRKLDARCMKDILPMYESGVTPARIGALYHVNENTIRNAVRENGGKVRGMRDDVHRRLPLDIHAFEGDSEDAQYWIGFAITDGNVHENGTFSIGLQAGDVLHLYKLRKFLNSGARIVKGTINRGGYKPGAKFVKLAVASKILVDSLKAAGVVPCKTGKEQLLRFQFSRHTWRGAIDGDGSVGWHKRGYFWIKLYGSKVLCEQFREFVLTLIANCRAQVHRSGNIYAFGLCCGPAEIVARELYRDCATYLSRKHKTVRPLLISN